MKGTDVGKTMPQKHCGKQKT